MKQIIKIDTNNSKSIPSYVDIESISNLEINSDPFILVGKNNSGKSTLLNILSNSKTKFIMGDEKITPIVIKIDSENLNLNNENKRTSKIKELINFENNLKPENFYLSQLNNELSKKFEIKFEREISPILKAKYENIDISDCGNGINKLLYINWIVDKVDLIYNFEANKSIKEYGIEKLLIEIFIKFLEDGNLFYEEIKTYLKNLNISRNINSVRFLPPDQEDIFDNDKNEIGAKKSLDNTPYFKSDKIYESHIFNTKSIMSTNVYKYLIENFTKIDSEKNKILFKKNFFTISHLFDALINKKIIKNSDYEQIIKNLNEIEIDISPPSKCILFLIDEPENSLQESFRKEIVDLINKLSGELKTYDFRFVVSTHSENMLWLMKDKLENYHVAYKTNNSVIKYKNIFNNDFDSFCSKINSTYDKLCFTKGGKKYNVKKEYISYLITQIDTLRIFFSENITFVEGYDEKLIFESMGEIVTPTDGYYNLIILFDLIENFHEHFDEINTIIDYDISIQKQTMDESNKKIINYLNEKESFVNSKFKILQSKYKDIISFAKDVNEIFGQSKTIDPFMIKSNNLEFKNKKLDDIVFMNGREPLQIITNDNLVKSRKPKLESIFDSYEILKISDKLFLIKNFDVLDSNHKIFLEVNDDQFEIYMEVTLNDKTTKFTIFDNDNINNINIIFNPYLIYTHAILDVEKNVFAHSDALISNLTFVIKEEINKEDFKIKFGNAFESFDLEKNYIFNSFNWEKNKFDYEKINGELTQISKYLVIDFDESLTIDKVIENSKFSLKKIISDFIYQQN